MSPTRFGVPSAAQIHGRLAIRARRVLGLSLRTFFLSLLSGSVGEGWSLTLGSITADRYTAQGPGGVQTWYSINGVAGVSDRLVPNPNNQTSFLTEHISQLKIIQVGSGNTACFHVWDTSGTYYEFGCTTDSLQFDKNSSGDQQNYRWGLDKVVLPNEGPGNPNKWIIRSTCESLICAAAKHWTVAAVTHPSVGT